MTVAPHHTATGARHPGAPRTTTAPPGGAARPSLVQRAGLTGLGSALLAPAGRGCAILSGRLWQWCTTRTDDDPSRPWWRCASVAAAAAVTIGCPYTTYLAIGSGSVLVVVAMAIGYREPQAEDEQPGEAEDQPEQAEPLTPEEVRAAVRDVIGDDRGALLTALAPALDAPDTKTVRELLVAAGIRVSAGVRTPRGNGPGVHRKDLPPIPSPAPSSAPVGVVAAGQHANTNTNAIRREQIGEGMTIIRRPGETRRYEISKGTGG